MTNCDFTDLESLLAEVRGSAIQAKEPTLFAVGGRGYYENPASDLLAFFLRPDAIHELNDSFLSTFLKCMEKDPHDFNMNSVSVEREVETQDLSRIDLEILGPDWCLLIENKIYHIPTNPFASYEAHAKGRGKKTNLFAILSPKGYSIKEGWMGISYSAYCKALREKMPEIDSYRPASKWQLFAREFILHLENELYNPPMTTQEQAFVERHADQIAVLQKLAAQYIAFVLEELKQRLEARLSGYIFNTRDVGWGFRCSTPQWGNSDVVLLKPKGSGQKFLIRTYLGDMSETRLSNAKQSLKHMNPPEIGREYAYWDSPIGYDSKEEAIVELCNLAQIMSDLLKQ